MFHRFLTLSSILLGLVAFAQASSQASVDNAFVQKQFGDTCDVLTNVAPYVGDLDGDGVEDIVIPANCKNPMSDQAEHGFHVIDPYYSFFGYGNPSVTTSFVTDDPSTKGLSLLVIHGLGTEAWRADSPKAKFVIVNIPFKAVRIKKLQLRKRSVDAIFVEEKGGDHMTSATFWDGKRYRYEPMGSTLE